MVCTDPADGPVTFTVQAGDVHGATDIRIAVAAPNGFLELDGSDNSDRVRLLPRPTYDFSMGALRAGTHTVAGGTDHYTLTSQVGARPGRGQRAHLRGHRRHASPPARAPAAAGSTPPTSAAATSAPPATCDLRVDSTSEAAHDIGLSLQVPRGYDDPDPSNDSAHHRPSRPGIDLALGGLTPANPVPAGNGTYVVTTTLTGVRSGPVRFTVDGAEVTASSCSVTSDTLVTLRRAHRGPAGLPHAAVGQGHRRHPGDGHAPPAPTATPSSRRPTTPPPRRWRPTSRSAA